MSLKNARLAANFTGQQVAKLLHKAIDHRIEPGLYSKMEAGLCLPTPAQFKLICSLLGMKPSDIYRKEDVDFGITINKPSTALKAPLEPDTYKLTVRLPLPLVDGLQARLKRNGFPSITAYICDCIRRLK